VWGYRCWAWGYGVERGVTGVELGVPGAQRGITVFEPVVTGVAQEADSRPATYLLLQSHGRDQDAHWTA
jgi:hypothetical protein